MQLKESIDDLAVEQLIVTVSDHVPSCHPSHEDIEAGYKKAVYDRFLPSVSLYHVYYVNIP